MLIKKLRIGFVLLLAIMIVATPTMFLAQGQVQPFHQADLVEIADKAQQKIESLFNWIETQQIDDTKLQTDLVEYTDLFDEGKTLLETAKVAIEAEDFESAVEDTLDALKIFRSVLKSVNLSLKEAGINTEELVDSQGFLEAIVRARARIAYLRVIFEDDSTVEDLLDQAEEFLVTAEEVYEDDLSKATYNLRKANQLISQVHAILKEEAGLYNEWRLFDYCDKLQERTRERFRGGREQGVNVDVFLESLGYQNENQFMETLEGLIQNAKNNSENFKDSLEVLEAIGNMIRQMDGELTQEINQHQNRYGSGGNGAGNFGGQSGGNP
jgi:flagellin-specific chaperone FliS